MPTPADKELQNRLEALDAASLCDAASSAEVTIGVTDSSIRLFSAGTKMVGWARPVACDADLLEVMKALSQAREGEVLVVGGTGRKAVVGELFANEAKRRGMSGIVIDGFCRDLPQLKRLEMPVFARGATPQAGTSSSAHGAVQAASISGVVVESEDLVFGDEDGVVIVPANKIDEILPIAEEIQSMEGEILQAVQKGQNFFRYTNIEEHYQRRADRLPSKLRISSS